MKNMDEQNLFQPVLDDNEQVLKVLRPHKGRAWFSTIVGIMVWSLVLLPVGIISLIFHKPADLESEDTLGIGIFVLVMWAFVTLISLICIALWCNKTVYAWTNKRILIRTGFIGVDYKSLDLNMVGALSVNVNVADKIVHKNTGTITFGSMASPMMTQNASKFCFAYVHEPYQIYKEIKAYIDQKKSSESGK